MSLLYRSIWTNVIPIEPDLSVEADLITHSILADMSSEQRVSALQSLNGCGTAQPERTMKSPLLLCAEQG